MDKVYIVLVNWNGWQDTIDCLESVYRNKYDNYRVVVVDNCSRDESIERIKQWAIGESPGALNYADQLHYLTDPRVTKPVLHVEYDRSAAERGGDPGIEPPLILIRSGHNAGFSGGNNIALRYALARGNFKYVWLLNNDTVITPDALAALVRRMEECPAAGMCGSLLPYYDKPGIIWAQGGGTLNRWLARSACIGNGMSLSSGFSRDDVESRLQYVAGASILVSKEFIEETGLMSEDYFLYFEEPDWALRGLRRYTLAYAPDSIVYHKVGMSTKKGYDLNKDIEFPDAYLFKSSLKFTKKHFPIALPIVFIRVLSNRIKAAVVNYIRQAASRAAS